MKTHAIVKHIGIAAVAVIVAIGCSTSPTRGGSGSSQAATDATESAKESYQVVSGDTLWGIAAMNNIYADPYQWPLIYRLNSTKIKDADLIYPGQVFSIDRAPTNAEMNGAVAHAKSRGAWSVGVVEDSDRAYLGQ